MSEKFIPYEKLSKKKQKMLNKEKRNNWSINPTTRVVSDKTKYNRSKFKQFAEE